MGALMQIRTIGVMSPGEMGHAVGRVLRAAGLRVLTRLDGRSERTATRSASAGIIAVGDDRALVREADLILSILPPADALALAGRIAAAVARTGADLLYVDCNAIAPATTCTIDTVLADVGIRYVDGGIIGGPPASGQQPTRLYVSGPEGPSLTELQTPELHIHVLGPSIGQASGLKMCYAALSKGLTALATESLAASHALGSKTTSGTNCRRARRHYSPGSTAASPGCRPKQAAGLGRWRRSRPPSGQWDCRRSQ
jgi:3-hydroxyisobutyrate dehydrogenase-like beta-hydroxyacid dehydrogenase